MSDDPHPLPPLYAAWIADAIPGLAPARERKATCDRCVMCVQPDGALPTATITFRPDVKCCSFVPRFANFLVGRALADEDASPVAAAGRASLERRLVARIGASPLGLDLAPADELLHRNAAGAFGQTPALRCPHWVDEDGGRCGVWRHREAVCTTWFCQFVRGRVGVDLWAGVRRLLQVAEREVARWCALEAGIDAGWLAAVCPSQDDAGPGGIVPWQQVVLGEVDDAAWAYAWGPWRGRERDFYLEAGRRASALRWQDILALGGTELRLRQEALRRLAARHADPALPERLRAGSFQVAGTRPDGGVRAVTYSSLDAIDLPSPLLALLPRFDGRPTTDVLSELRAQGVELDPDFLRQLVDWGILVG